METSPVPGTPVAFTPETRTLVSPGDIPLLEQIDQENIKVAAAVRPSIVRITVTKPIDPRMQAFGNRPAFPVPLWSRDLPFHSTK